MEEFIVEGGRNKTGCPLYDEEKADLASFKRGYGWNLASVSAWFLNRLVKCPCQM